MVWYIFTKDVSIDQLSDIREMISKPPEPDQMSKRVTQLAQMGGTSVAIGGTNG